MGLSQSQEHSPEDAGGETYEERFAFKVKLAPVIERGDSLRFDAAGAHVHEWRALDLGPSPFAELGASCPTLARSTC